jgi:hypothetical protein
MNNEAVAWHYPEGKPDQCTTNKEYAEKAPAWTPMYYKHEWVGLDDDDYKVLREGVVKQGKPIAWMIEQIEAKLKEKNT